MSEKSQQTCMWITNASCIALCTIFFLENITAKRMYPPSIFKKINTAFSTQKEDMSRLATSSSRKLDNAEIVKRYCLMR